MTKTHEAENQIQRAYIRHYSDNNQTTAYVEWSNGSRTESNIDGIGLHMLSLLQRAKRNGLKIEREDW